MNKQIRIECEGAGVLGLSDIREFQGSLKKRKKSDYDKIIKSIMEYGFSFPFFVWKEGAINWCLDGHGRLSALKQLEKSGVVMPKFPVAYVEAVDVSVAKQKLLRMNSQFGEITQEGLLEFLGEETLDVDSLSSNLTDLLPAVVEETIGDDDAPLITKKSDSVLGGVYELGGHLLTCGDSTEEATIKRIMGDGKADLFLTDPPYNVSYSGGSSRDLASKKIKNDSMPSSEFLPFIQKALDAGASFLKEGGSFYIWYGETEGLSFRLACDAANLDVKQVLIWNKSQFCMGRSDYHWKHEPCLYGWKTIFDEDFDPVLYGWKKGNAHSWLGDRKQSTVFDFPKPTRSDEHPTMKPVEIFQYFIENSTVEGEIVLDTFGGSGTAIISSEKCGRIARVVELDPKFCDVIRRRWTKWATINGIPVGSGGLV